MVQMLYCCTILYFCKLCSLKKCPKFSKLYLSFIKPNSILVPKDVHGYLCQKSNHRFPRTKVSGANCKQLILREMLQILQ